MWQLGKINIRSRACKQCLHYVCCVYSYTVPYSLSCVCILIIYWTRNDWLCTRQSILLRKVNTHTHLMREINQWSTVRHSLPLAVSHSRLAVMSRLSYSGLIRLFQMWLICWLLAPQYAKYYNTHTCTTNVRVCTDQGIIHIRHIDTSL